MAVRDTLNKVENLVASASHLPLTGKALIDEEELVHLIEELRKELPQELDRAEQIIRDCDNKIKAAEKEAERIKKQAEKRAEQLVDENDVVTKAIAKARTIETQANQKAAEIVEHANSEARTLRLSAQQYANDVLDKLISNVTGTAETVHAIHTNLEGAYRVLSQAKMAFGNTNNTYSYSQPPAPEYQQQNFSQPQQNYQQQNMPQNYQQQNYPQNPQK